MTYKIHLCGLLLSCSRYPVPPPAPSLQQIDSSYKQCQFLMAEQHLRLCAFGFRPAEAALLQAFRAHPQPTAIPEKQLQAIALCVREQKNVSAQRLTQQPVAHQTVEPFEALAHIGR